VRAAVLILLASLTGCAAFEADLLNRRTMPYVAEFHTRPWSPDWFADGDDMVLAVHNPLPWAVNVTVQCHNHDYAPDLEYWRVMVPASGESRGIAQIMNEQRNTSACFVLDWSFTK